MDVTFEEYIKKFEKALSVPFSFEEACPSSLHKFIKEYADSLMVNERCLFFPLLSCCAACIGPRSYLEITPNWREPPIIWSLVVTPRTLQRIDVAEHLKEQLASVQEELSCPLRDECLFDDIRFQIPEVNMNNLEKVLKYNRGQAFGLYSSTRALKETISTTQDVHIMSNLFNGSSWFSNSSKDFIAKTHANFSIVTSLQDAYNSLTTLPNFEELYYGCFLTFCVEENRSRLSQLPFPEDGELQRIFKEIIELHLEGGIVYKLGKEARELFIRIEDDVTFRAKKLAQKFAEKIFRYPLKYIARLSLVLHVMDNVLNAINSSMPINLLTWDSEIGAESVAQAECIISHSILQRLSLISCPQ